MIHDYVPLPTGAEAPAAARRAVLALEGRIPEPVLEDVMLVASELATNAVIHALPDPRPTLEIAACPGLLSVAVTSSSGEHFGRDSRRVSAGSNGGFGLNVVDAVSSRWWVEHSVVDRIVCEFDLGQTA